MRATINLLGVLLMARLAVFLDAILSRTAHWFPGVSSGGVFYRQQQPLIHFDKWTEPTAYMLQISRLEVILDRA